MIEADWAHGREGTAQALTLAVTGRRAVLDQLSGEGVDTLQRRD